MLNHNAAIATRPNVSPLFPATIRRKLPEGAARFGRRKQDAPYVPPAAPFIDRAQPHGAAVTDQKSWSAKIAPETGGVYYRWAELHLADPNAWATERLAAATWFAFGATDAERVKSEYDPRDWDHRPINLNSLNIPEKRAKDEYESATKRRASSFLERRKAGKIKCFGRTDPIDANSIEEISPEAWPFLKRLYDPSGGPAFTYIVGGVTKKTYHRLLVWDTEGVPLEQAAWAYATPDLAAALSDNERQGASAAKDLHKSWEGLIDVRQQRAEARLKWPALIAEATGNLESMIASGVLEQSGGTVRPAHLMQDIQAVSISVEGEPASKNDLVQPNPVVSGRTHARVPTKNEIDAAIVTMIQMASDGVIRQKADWFDIAKQLVDHISETYFIDHFWHALLDAAKEAELTLVKLGRPFKPKLKIPKEKDTNN